MGLVCLCEKEVWKPVYFIGRNFVIMDFQLDVTCLYYSVFICVLLKVEISRSFECALLRSLLIANYTVKFMFFILLKDGSKICFCKNCPCLYVDAG